MKVKEDIKTFKKKSLANRMRNEISKHAREWAEFLAEEFSDKETIEQVGAEKTFGNRNLLVRTVDIELLAERISGKIEKGDCLFVENDEIHEEERGFICKIPFL